MGIFDIFKKKQVEQVTPLYPERIKDNELIAGLQSNIQALQAQISKLLAEKARAEEKIKPDTHVDETVESINKQFLEIKEKKFGNSFSFGKLFAAKFGVNPKRTNLDIELTDKDDEVVFGKFGDIVALSPGRLGITNHEGRLISYGQTLSNIIHKPDSLKNHLKRLRIPLAIDKDGNYTPDIETEEYPETIYDEDAEILDEDGNSTGLRGVYRTAHEHRTPLNKQIVRLMEEKEVLRGKLETTEAKLIKLTSITKDQAMVIRLLEKRSDISQSTLSQALDKTMQIEGKFSETSSKIAQLTELKAHAETMAVTYQNIVDKLMRKIELHGDKGMAELIKSEIMDDIASIKELLPQEKPVFFENTPKTVQPGQYLPKTP